jgi:hypothetical protein
MTVHAFLLLDAAYFFKKRLVIERKLSHPLLLGIMFPLLLGQQLL